LQKYPLVGTSQWAEADETTYEWISAGQEEESGSGRTEKGVGSPERGMSGH